MVRRHPFLVAGLLAGGFALARMVWSRMKRPSREADMTNRRGDGQIPASDVAESTQSVSSTQFDGGGI